MGSPSPASSSKTKEASPKTTKATLLESKRFLELMGLLIERGRLADSPQSCILPAPGPFIKYCRGHWNVAAQLDWPRRVVTWRTAFCNPSVGWPILLPLALLVVGGTLASGKAVCGSPHQNVGRCNAVGISLGALLELFPYTPSIHGVLRGGGLLGYLVAAGLIHTFNPPGRKHCGRNGLPDFAISGHPLLFWLGGGIP